MVSYFIIVFLAMQPDIVHVEGVTELFDGRVVGREEVGTVPRKNEVHDSQRIAVNEKILKYLFINISRILQFLSVYL